MSPLPDTIREREARELDTLVNLLDSVFKAKPVVKSLAKQYNLFIKDKVLINAEALSGSINPEMTTSRQKLVKQRLITNIKNTVIRGASPKFGDISSLVHKNSEFVMKQVKTGLKNEGLLLNKRYWDIRIPSIYLHKFIKMLNSFEDFSKKHQNDYTEIKADIGVKIKLEHEEWFT